MSTVERIFELMKKHGITAKDLAAIIGIAASAFTEWKKGRSNPSAESVKKIADYFDVSVDYLLCRTDDPGDVLFSANLSEELKGSAKAEPRQVLPHHLGMMMSKDNPWYDEFVRKLNDISDADKKIIFDLVDSLAKKNKDESEGK